MSPLFQEQPPEPAPGMGGTPSLPDLGTTAPVTPAAPAAPVAPTPAPTAAPTAEPAQPVEAPLTRETLIQMAGSDGQPISVPLGQLADLHRSITPDKLTQYQQIEKALQGDTEATRALMEGLLPKPEEKTPEAEVLSSLQKRVDDLASLVEGRIGPGLAGMQTQTEMTHLAEYLKINAASYPFLSRNPQGATMVHGQLRQLQGQIQKQYQTDLSTLPQDAQLKILQKAFTDCEMGLKNLVGLYHPAAQPAAPGSNIQSVNDQTGALGEPSRLGRWPLDDRGVPIISQPVKAQTPTVRDALAPLPATPVNQVPMGGPANVETAQPQGPMTSEALAARIRARTQSAV